MLEKIVLTAPEMVNSNEAITRGKEPIRIGSTEIAPNVWKRHPIVAIYPDKSADAEGRWIVHYDTKDGVKKASLDSISTSPDYILEMDGEPLNTISRNYSPVTNYEIVEAMLDALTKREINPTRLSISGTKRYSRMVFLLDETTLINNDEHKTGFFVYNSTDMSTGFRMGFYAFRSVCSNGLMVYNKKYGYLQMKHTAPEKNILAARERMEEYLNHSGYEMADAITRMSKLSAAPVGKDLATKIATTLGLRKWELDQINRATYQFPMDADGHLTPEPGYTGWDMLNDVTAIARLNRDGDVDRNPNPKRADLLESKILDCLVP